MLGGGDGGAADNGGKEQIHFVAADQAAARATVLTLADIGKGYTGGAKKPDLSPGPTCPHFHPKQSDLILTGAAETDFSATEGLRDVDTVVQILKTAKMVQLDWNRTFRAPGLISCLKSYLAKTAPHGAKVLSIKKLVFPRVANYSAAYRILVEITASGQTARVIIDEVFIASGRTEISLTQVAFEDIEPVVLLMDEHWARMLASRIRA